MKACTKCNDDLPPDAFGKNRRSKDGLQHWCKACTNTYQAEVYRRGGKASLLRRSKAKCFTRNTNYILEYLRGHPCVDCGETDPVVLHFDHVHGKNQDISVMLRWGCSLQRLQAEVALCEVRCANCHMRVTAIRHGGWWRMVTGSDLTMV